MPERRKLYEPGCILADFADNISCYRNCNYGAYHHWFAGGAFVAIIAAALNTPLYVQITLFLIVSVVLLLFTRPIAMKYFNKDRIKTNAESLIGKQAVVTEDIDNLLAVGLVSINGQEWTARNVVDGMKIPKGTVVIVRAISGVKLIVEERREGM